MSKIRIFGKGVKIPINKNYELQFYIDINGNLRYMEMWRFGNKYTGLIRFAKPILEGVRK